MQLFSLPFLFSGSKESGQNDDPSQNSCSSDESDSRFMNEHDMSFIPLHPHQRVEQLKLNQVMAPMDNAVSPHSFPIHVQSKASDDVSLLSFEGESSVLSGNSSSVGLNSYGTKSTPSHLAVAIRWRKNLDMAKKQGQEHLQSVDESAPVDISQRERNERMNRYLRFQDKLERFEDATVVSRDSTAGFVEKSQTSGMSSGVLQKTLRSASAATASPSRNVENDKKGRSSNVKKDVYLEWANKVYTRRNEFTTESSSQPLPPPPPPLDPPKIKKKYSGSQFQISPPSIVKKASSDYPLSEADGRFSTKSSPGRNEKTSVQVGLGSQRKYSNLKPLCHEMGESQNFSQLKSRPEAAGNQTDTTTMSSKLQTLLSTPEKLKDECFAMECDKKTCVYSTPKMKLMHSSSPIKCGSSTLEMSCPRSSASYAFSSSSSESSLESDSDFSDDLVSKESYLDPPRCTPSNLNRCSMESRDHSRFPSFEENMEVAKHLSDLKHRVVKGLGEQCQSQDERIDSRSKEMAKHLKSNTNEVCSRTKNDMKIKVTLDEESSNGSPIQILRRNLNLSSPCSPNPKYRKKEDIKVKMVQLVDINEVPDVSSTPSSMTAFEKRTKEWMNRMWSPDMGEWDYVGDTMSQMSPCAKTSNLDTTQPMTDGEDEDEDLFHRSKSSDNEKRYLREAKTPGNFDQKTNIQDKISMEYCLPIGSPHSGNTSPAKTPSRTRNIKDSRHSETSLTYSMHSASALLSTQQDHTHFSKVTTPLSMNNNINAGDNASVTSDFEAKRKVISQTAAMNCRLLTNLENTNHVQQFDENEHKPGKMEEVQRCVYITPSPGQSAEYNGMSVSVESARNLRNPEKVLRHNAATKIQSNYRGMQSRYEVIKMLGVEKRKRWQPRLKSQTVTKIHSNIRRAARSQLRERYVLGTTERSTSSMAVAVRRVCALIIQHWWKKHLKLLKASRLNAFDSSDFPSTWKNVSTKSDNPFITVEKVGGCIFEDRTAHVQTVQASMSKGGDSQTSGTRSSDFSLQCEKFESSCDNAYYDKSHANLYEDDLEDTKRFTQDENVEASISLLTKIQNGILGRFVKYFKKRTKKTKRKTQQRLRKIFKKKKNHKSVTEQKTAMIGDPETQTELPDPLSLYLPLVEEDENNVRIQDETQSGSEQDALTGIATQWVAPDAESVNSFSLLAGSFGVEEYAPSGFGAHFEDDDDCSSSEAGDSVSLFTYSDVALVEAMTIDPAPFDEI